MSSSPKTREESTQLLPDMLRRTGAELRRLELLTSQVETAMLNMDRVGQMPKEHGLTDVQHLDRIAQTLKDLAGFLERLGDALPPEEIVDAANALNHMTLVDVAATLRRGVPTNESDGDVEIL